MINARDAFCAKCGTRQPVQPVQPDFLSGITPRTASILCYIPTLGWIAAVIVLATRKFRSDRTVRFHAFQCLYLFGLWLSIQWVLKPLFQDASEAFVHIDRLLEGIIMGVLSFMMVNWAERRAPNKCKVGVPPALLTCKPIFFTGS